MTWIVIIAGAVLFGLYMLGRMTPAGQLRVFQEEGIISEGVPQWAKVLAFIVVVCAVIIWFVA
jgi:hypothetical protein